MSPSAQKNPEAVASRTSEVRQTNGDGKNGNSRKITTLRDATQRSITMYRTELGSSSEQFLTSCQSVETFFDFVAGIRLRQMPHHSSRWDKILKWAEFFAAQVYGYSDEVSHFADYAEQAAQIIWASCLSLLKLGPKYVAVLEKAFGVFYSAGLSLGFFLRHHELLHSSEELQLIMAASFTDLLKLVTGISIYYTRKELHATFSARSFDERFGQNIDSFFHHGDRFTDTVWETRLSSLAKPGDVSVDLVREFLMPHDRVTRILAVSRYIKRPRADFTCEWFDRHLTEFTRSGVEVMLVTGKPATGKTVLSEWVVERLQSLNGRRASEVVTYTIDPDLKTEQTTLSVVKGLLLQMLQLSVGDNTLYKSLQVAYELSIKGSPVSQVEDALWKALEGGLRSDRNQTIVVDGIDHLKSGESDGLKLLERLHSIASKHSKTKVIVFSRPISKATPKGYTHFSIETANIEQDIQYVAESSLSTLTCLEHLSPKDRTTLTSTLVKSSSGSFGWLNQAIEILKVEKTPESVLKRAGTLPKTLPELLEITIGTLDLKHRDTKSILAWLLAAERPLLLGEVRQLIEVDASTCTRSPRSTRIEDDVVRSIGPLVDIRDGFVRFRHSTIKENILGRALSVTDFKNSGPFPFNIKEAHYDLTIRTLAYIKIYLNRPTQPTLQPLNGYELDEVFRSYELLQYAVRYWSLHFQESPMHEPSVQHNVTQGFKTCFPDNTLLAVLEGSTYQFQYPINDTINFYLLTLSVRRLVLGDTSEPVLQTLLNIARTKQVLLKPTEPNQYYYEAWKLATTLRLTTISTICAHKYIETTTHITTTSKTDVTTTRRIELLQYIITIQRETKVTDREILVYLEALATLYITIGEIEKASQYYREIYEVNVRIYGRTAPQTLRSYETLSTTIQKTTKTEEIQEITRKKYDEISRTLDVTDQRRTNLTWSLIEYYEKKNDTYRLEEILVSFWQSLTRLGHTKDTTIQERKIDVALRYVEFLKRQKRTVEAENILRGLWVDLEQQDNDSAAVITRTKTVGDQLQSLGSIDAARSIFARLWTYYAKTGKTDTAEAKSVSTSLTKTTHESTSETTYEVITLREIFETTIIRSTTKTIDTTTVKTAVTLVDTYWQRQEWTEVVKYATFTLQKLWSAFNTDDLNAPLPSTYTTETIELINRLGFAHYKLRQLEPAERIYRRIFFAVKNTPNTPDELLLSSSKTLIDFYETHTMLEKSVIIYRELYTEIQKRHGKTNTLTINTLYTLGDLAVKLNDTKNAEFAYREIHTNLGTEITHRDAIRAALALATIYEQQRQYQQAQKTYASLWAMFIKHGKDYDLKPDFAEELYQKYVRILKQETKTDYPVIRQLTIDYRKALVRFYGVSHEVTLKATMTLADINEEKEEHREEAIALYEEADQKSRDLPKGQISQPTLTSIVEARKKLPHLYSTSKLSTSPRAITLYTEEFQNNNTKHGHAHRDTLIWLSLLIIAHAKQGNKESTLKANQIVKASIIDILKNEKNTQRLADSGVKTAEIYVKSGLKPDAEKLLVHLRSQAVFGDSDLSKPLGLAPGAKLDARVWVFIIAFQVTLAGRKDIYSSSMADLINEVFMYEAYRRSVSQKAPFLTSLVYGSRILQFTRDIHDDEGTARVEKEVLEYFSTNLNAPKTTNFSVLREFFGVVITEIHTLEPDVSVLKASLETVGGLVDKSKFQEAYDLAFLIDRFQQFQGGYSNIIKIDLGFKLALILAGRGKPKSPDQKLRSVMLELSSTITKQILKTIRAAQLSVTDIPIILLNEISGLLGEQNNLDDLEWILTELWQARHAQQSWSSSVVVNIGRRLVETQFAHGHQETAIHLCEDMCYNLRRVWGALDATTLEMHNLLSSFYTNAGNYRKALLVHEDVLRDTVSDKGDELPSAEASQIAVQHLELLKRAYQRLGGWDKDQQVYVDLYQQLAHVFGSEENWKNAKTQSVEKWQPKGADQLGVWTRPESFEFDESKAARKHANYLRKSSGIWRVLGHGHSHRLSRAYSTQSINAQ